jgi:CRP-like cAMP-binding protein
MLTANLCSDCPVKQECIFSRAKLSQVHSLVDCLLTFHFKKGQSLFMEGDKKKGIYFIKEGKIKCIKLDQEGKEVIFNFVTSGDTLGYSLIFLDAENHEYCSVCMEDSTICYMPYHLTKNEIQNNHEFLKLITQILYKDMSSLLQIVMNGAHKNVRERIASSIMILQQKFGNDEEGYINISVTREELANMSATTIESSIRYISEFQKDKIINIRNKKIKITDVIKFSKLIGNAKVPY